MTNIQKMVCYFTLYFTCVDVTFMNYKSFLKLIAEPMYCFPQHLHDINYIAFLEVHFKIILILYLHLFSKQANSVEATTFSVDITSFMEFF